MWETYFFCQRPKGAFNRDRVQEIVGDETWFRERVNGCMVVIETNREWSLEERRAVQHELATTLERLSTVMVECCSYKEPG